MYEFTIPEEKHFLIAGRGHVFIIDDFKDKSFKLQDHIKINEQECIIKGIESMQDLFGKPTCLALCVYGYK